MSRSYPNLQRFEHMQWQWLTAPATVFGLKSYEKVNSALKRSWPDYQVCAICPSATRDRQIGEVAHLYEKDQYKVCGMCLKDEKQQIFDFSVPADFNIRRMKEVLDAYLSIRKQVNDDAQERRLKAIRSRDVRDKGVAPVTVASKEMLLLERKAWSSLLAIAFDHVRPRLMILMDKFNDTYESVEGEDGEDILDMGADADSMIRFLRDVVSYHNSRVGVTEVPQIYCFAHNTLGHAFPVDGRLGYKSCWICSKYAAAGVPTEATSFVREEVEEDDEKIPGKYYD